MIARLFISLLLIGVVGWSLEDYARSQVKRESEVIPTNDIQEYLDILADVKISGREIGTQFIAHNAAILSSHTAPESVERAYIGTSRSKILRPSMFGFSAAINASGNSYNEITYGLLIQAELLRHQFPNLKTVFLESSLLLRRPAPPRFILEEDHKKYLTIVPNLYDLRDQLPYGQEYREYFDKQLINKELSSEKSYLFEERDRYKLSTLFTEGAGGKIPVHEDNVVMKLNPNGEPKTAMSWRLNKDEMRPTIPGDHPKLTRLKEVAGWQPWDYLFNMFSLWGDKHDIEVVFFQPPVRSDFYQEQLQYGLKEHESNLMAIAAQSKMPFINLNQPELGYGAEWGIFSDEDHMGTCEGSMLLIHAINRGYQAWKDTGDLSFAMPIGKVREFISSLDNPCHS